MEKIIFKNFPYRITPLNDRNLNQLQTNVENALNEKVDKVEGKGLSTNDFTTTEKNKLGGIEPGANKYTHPASHPASIITQDSNNRFVTDSEKNKWNNKQDILNVNGRSVPYNSDIMVGEPTSSILATSEVFPTGARTLVTRNIKGRSKIADPIDPYDIANKQYVDDLINSLIEWEEI